MWTEIVLEDADGTTLVLQVRKGLSVQKERVIEVRTPFGTYSVKPDSVIRSMTALRSVLDGA